MNKRKKISYRINHKINQDKRVAIQSAQKLVQGDIVLIQNGDLEYDPRDYSKHLYAINKVLRVVYGSRVLGKNN
tara:strand:- start:719 stop:940 length:222 start_codon:yes stop_codon:yes gene_type:complete